VEVARVKDGRTGNDVSENGRVRVHRCGYARDPMRESGC